MTISHLPAGATPADPHPASQRDGRRVTSYDVALVAGVSQSAVSRCFKPGASVSKATYARVMKAAAQLDYIPNAAARSLITRRSNMVAVLIDHGAGPDILTELSQQIARHGKRILLFSLARDGELEHALADVWQFQVDGAIAATALSDRQVAEFCRRRVPLVLLNGSSRGQPARSVCCDMQEAGRTLVSRLAAAGHRQFGIIAGPATSLTAQQRRHGMCERLAELGLPAPAVFTGNDDYASGALGLRDILRQLGRPPDALICAGDATAIGALDCARHELDIAVPAQLSIAGYDTVEPADRLGYQLTTLRQPLRKMAAAAADLLAAQMGAADQVAEQRIFSALFVEGATARLAATPHASDSRAA